MRVKKQLLDFKKKFDPRLASFFNKKISQVKKIDPKTAALVKQIKDLALRGGKRLRPAFLYYGFKACGGKNNEKVFPYCLAIELLHSMALIHDDIMDNADLRRGRPAVHRVLGVSGAILAGDLCFSWAEELFGSGPRKYWDLLKEEVILGQYLDILPLHKVGQNTTRSRGILSHLTNLEREVLKILEYKTARYSVIRPLQIGANLAGAKKKELNVLVNYGLPLGIAFQITDDILGMFGEEKIIGKPVDSDLKEGKITLLIVRTISKFKVQSSKFKTTAQNLKLKRLLFLLGNKGATRKDLEWVRGLIKETGALKYCQNKAKELAIGAKRAVKDYPFEKEAKDFFLAIADFVIKRQY